MGKIIKFIQNTDERINLTLSYIAGVSSLFCMVLIFSDVGGRYLFNTPISGTLEVSQLLLTVMIFGSITYLELRQSHIKITLLYSRYPPKIQRVFDILSQGLQTVLFAFFANQTFFYFYFSWAMDEISAGSIALPLWIPKFVIFLGCFLFFLHSFGDFTLKLAGRGERGEKE